MGVTVSSIASRLRSSGAALRAELLKTAEELSRKPGEHPDAEARSYHWARIAVFSIIVLGAAGIFVPVLATRWQEMTESTIALRFTKERWKLIPPGTVSQAACFDSQSGLDCPAHPESPLPAKSELTRADPDHAERVRRFGPEPFWVVYDFTAEEAKNAAAQSANHLFIGIINGKYRIFINGNLMKESPAKPERALISVSIPVEWLTRANRVAIWIQNNTQSAFPDIFESASFRATGLLAADTLDGMLGLDNFLNENRHFILATVYGLISVFFFSLWLATPRKRELFYFAVFGVALGFLSLRLAVSFYLSLPRIQTYQLELLLRIGEASAALYAGLAMSRLRRIVGFVFLGPIPFLLLFFFSSARSGPDFLIYSSWVGKHLVPIYYLLSSVSCLLQWYWVRTQVSQRRAHWLRTRAWRLAAFSLIFLSLGIVYAWQGRYFGSPGMLATFHRYTPLLGFLAGAMILFREFRDQSQQMEYTPVSKYHRMNPLPEKVQGLVLEVDLKKSEVLYRAATHGSDQNILVFPFVDSWMTIARSCGGELMEYQGDMVRVIFETSSSRPETLVSRLLEVSNSVSKMAALMPEIAQDLEQRTGHPVRELVSRPAFRATLSYGSIRPTLIGEGGRKMATWLNADSSHVLMRVARLADAEKTLVKSRFPELGSPPTSTLVLDEETIPQEAIQAVKRQIEAAGASFSGQIRTYLEEKKSHPPQLALVSWQEMASSNFSSQKIA